MNNINTLQPLELISKADEISRQLSFLAHPNRLKIVCMLRDGEAAVSTLGHANIITPRREGKTIHYSLTNPSMIYLIEALCVACKAMENAK
jgi:DNA-binding transcriptional ArsR family regulator